MSITDYYKAMTPSSADDIRAAQFDELLEDVSEEAQRQMRFYYNIFKSSVPNMGERMAKSAVISVLRWQAMTDTQRKQAAVIGNMIHEMYPKKEQK